MEMNRRQINALFQYLDGLDRYGINQIKTNFNKQNDLVSKALSNRIFELCDILKINKPMPFELSEKISSTYELIKWSYMRPTKKYISRQNQVVNNSLNIRNLNKDILANELNQDIDDQGIDQENNELQRKVCEIIIDRINYLLATSNFNNQNYIYFKDKIDAMVESEVELSTNKLCENTKELYELIKKKIRSLTDMIVYRVQSFVDSNHKGLQ